MKLLVCVIMSIISAQFSMVQGNNKRHFFYIVMHKLEGMPKVIHLTNLLEQMKEQKQRQIVKRQKLIRKPKDRKLRKFVEIKLKMERTDENYFKKKMLLASSLKWKKNKENYFRMKELSASRLKWKENMKIIF